MHGRTKEFKDEQITKLGKSIKMYIYRWEYRNKIEINRSLLKPQVWVFKKRKIKIHTTQNKAKTDLIVVNNFLFPEIG